MGKVFHGGGGFLTVGGWWVLRLCGGGDGECCVCAVGGTVSVAFVRHHQSQI